MDSAKIINKFIPKTSSHTRTRISKIVKAIKSKNKKNKGKTKKRTGIKTYKRRYQEKILKNINVQPVQEPKEQKIKTKEQKIKTKELIQPVQEPIQPVQEPIQPVQELIQPVQEPIQPVQPVQPVQESIQPVQESIQPVQPQNYINQSIIPNQEIHYPNIELKNKKIVIPDMEVEKKDIHISNQIKNKSDTKDTKDTSDTKESSDNKYIIAIPSYNRADLLQVKTLALLHKHNIDPKIINIFVSDRYQYNLYKSKITKALYNKLIIGVKGLKNQRNYINNYYPQGYHIVEMDDDIDKIVQLDIKYGATPKASTPKGATPKASTKKIKPIENLDAFIKDAFQRCVANGIFLWGVYPLANPYFMTNKITTDLRFIVGPFWGMINRHREDLQLTIDEKENSERTLQNWVIDGKVLRFNNIGIETKYYKNKGGMQNNNKNSNYRKEAALNSVYYLHKKYPKLTKINLSKKSGFAEIKLLRK